MEQNENNFDKKYKTQDERLDRLEKEINNLRDEHGSTRFESEKLRKEFAEHQLKSEKPDEKSDDEKNDDEKKHKENLKKDETPDRIKEALEKTKD